MICIQHFQQVDRLPVILHGQLFWPIEIVWRILCIEVGSLKSRGQKPISEIVLSTARQSAWIVYRDEGRQLLVFRSECIRRPCTKRRKPFHRKAGVHKVFALWMGAGVRR